ncbi:MAG: hypothetical protein M3177_07425 [Pseudomonadota bacterium]|nr:hypothetical protein [Pseudomonadota bacterium]
MADLSTCTSPRCAYTVEGTLSACPKCGGPMRAVRESRVRGWAMLLLGLVLVLMTGAITWNMAPTLLQPGKEVDGGTFTGTSEQAKKILGLFAVLIGFGLASITNGMFQIATGRQSKLFTVLGLALAGLLLVIVFVTMRDIK